MDKRLAIIGIIVQNDGSVQSVNDLLHQNRSYIIGRMGVPYADRLISVIVIVVDAVPNVISALAGQLGRLSGVIVKTVYAPENLDARE